MYHIPMCSYSHVSYSHVSYSHVPYSHVSHSQALTADSMVRLAAAGCARILPLEDTIHVCHMMRNHPNAPYDRQVIEFDQDCGVAIEAVFLAYPKYVRVGGIPFDEVGMSKSDARTERVRICTVLYENGILLARPGKSGGE